MSVRLSPSGRRVAYVAGYGVRPPQPVVTVRFSDDSEIAIDAGHSTGWVFEDAIVVAPQEDGPLLTANAAGLWTPVPSTLPSGHVVAAAAGRVAVSRIDGGVRRILTSWGRTIVDADQPALTDDGEWLVYRLPDQPTGLATLVVEWADGEGDLRVLHTGGISAPARCGSRTCCWADGGRIYGVADVANPAAPVVDLTLDGWQCSHPVPVWVPARGELYAVLVRSTGGETGEIVLREWAEPRILVLGTSGGSAFDLDCRPVEVAA